MSRPAVRRSVSILAICLGSVLVLAAFYVGLGLWTNSRVPLQTVVAGIDVGGMDHASAEQAVERAASAAQEPMRLTTPESDFEIVPADAGINVDVNATVSQIANGGWMPVDILDWFYGSQDIAAVTAVDQPLLTGYVSNLADQLLEPAREPVLEFVGVTPTVRDGRVGRRLNASQTEDALVTQFLRPRTTIPAPFETDPPQVSAAALQRAQLAAQQFIGQGVTFSSGGATGTLSRRVLARSISFENANAAITTVVDGNLIRDRLLKRYPEFETPGTNAAFRIRKGVPTIVPSRSGTTVDPVDISRLVASAVTEYPPGGVVELARIPLEPELTEADAAGLGISERLSSFTQAFPYAAYRVQNIGQAARYIDGTILMPGETFSMNDTIKERTVANGYTVGIVIGPGGVFSEDLGGGVSAAATATWTAAFFAGMERVETRAHSIYISRYQPGLEATVAWGIFDMRFRNDTPNAVLITAKTTNTSMTVRFWGTPLYDEVLADFGPRTNVRPYSTIYDSSAGCLGQSGMAGFDIDVDRVFMQNGAEADRETISTSYRPAPAVICRSSPQDG
jgi:vancomycin resistance protein YoaR